MKSLYRHKQSGDLFAIETDERGNVLSTPLAAEPGPGPEDSGL